MAIIRRENWLNEQRVDVPHLRSVESAVCNDFDNLAGKGLAGRVPFVLRAFTIPVANTLGQSSSLLQLNVASGLIYHYGASESGTVFSVSDTQPPEPLNVNNTNVVGGFIAASTNYVGLDLNRNPDPSTIDTVAVLDVTTSLEIPEVVPLAITLQYKIVISTQAFSTSTNILPIAKVLTDGNNNVLSITDARNMLFRLGSGGDAANALNTYKWGSRSENPITYSGGADPFSGEDKIINNQASWMEAMMTSIWEVKGGEYWYAATNRDNVKLLYGQPTLVVNSDNFFYTGTNIQWSGLAVAYENALSGTYFNTITNSASIGGGTGLPLSNGQCLYVDIVRESAAALIPNVTNLWQLGTSVIPGRRFVIAWMYNNLVFVRDKAYEVGRTFPVATTTVLGLVELSATSNTPLAPKAISDGGGTITGNSATVALNVTGFSTSGAPAWQAGQFTGGSVTSGTGTAGSGLVGNGGNGSGAGSGGDGLDFQGGTGGNTSGTGGSGLAGFGGNGGTPNGPGGPGVFAGAGNGVGSGTGGIGLYINSLNITNPGSYGNTGQGGSTGNGGVGGYILGGYGGASGGNGADALHVIGGNSLSGSNNGGIGLLAQGGSATGGGSSGAGVNATGGPGAIGVIASGGTGGGEGGFFSGTGNSGGISGLGHGTGTGVTGIGGGTTGSLGGVFNAGVAAVSGTPQYAMQINNGYIQFNSVFNPDTSTTVTSNTLTPSNITKAWVSLTTNSSNTPQINEQFNVSSVTASASTITVTFLTPMGTGAYCPIANTNSGFCVIPSGGIATGSVAVNIYGLTITGGNINQITNLNSTSGTTVYLAVHATQ